jgi:hypothetical protein
MFKTISQDVLSRSKYLRAAVDSVGDETDPFKFAKAVENAANTFSNEEFAGLFELSSNEEIRRKAETLKTLDIDDERSDQLREELFNYAQVQKTRFIQNDNNPEESNTILYTEGNDFARAREYYDRIALKLETSPEEALEEIDKLSKFIESEGVANNVSEAIKGAFNINLLTNIANDIKTLVDLSKTLTPSPVIELAKIISFDVDGKENSFLDLIESQKGTLSKQTRSSEFMLPAEYRHDFEIVKKVYPIVESVL